MAKSKRELDELWVKLREVRAEIAYYKRPSRAPEKAVFDSTRKHREKQIDRLEAERARILDELKGAWG